MITIECFGKAKIYMIKCYLHHPITEQNGGFHILGYLPSSRMCDPSVAEEILGDRPALAKVCCKDVGMLNNPIQEAVVAEFLVALVEAETFLELSDPGAKILRSADYELVSDLSRSFELDGWHYSVIRKVGEES